MAVGRSKGIMARVKYPRALAVRFERGETIGPPKDHPAQRRVVKAALDLLVTAAPGEIRNFG